MEEKSEEKAEKKRPVKSFSYGGVDVALWDFGKGLSVTLQRTYKDSKTGEFKHTGFLNESDIPKAIEGLRDAYRHLTRKGE